MDIIYLVSCGGVYIGTGLRSLDTYTMERTVFPKTYTLILKTLPL